MKHYKLSLLTTLALLLFSCGSETSQSVNQGHEDSSETPANNNGCDPLVAEYSALLEDYKNGLQEMINEKEIDKDQVEEWSERADDLGKRIEDKGEKELGIKCWKEFNSIARQYSSEIPPLAMEIARIELGKQGIEMDMDALQKQIEEATSQE